MFLNIADSVKNAIDLGIDLLRDGAGIDVTAVTFIIQICATIVLFLFVRLFLWKTVRGMIDARKANIQKELDSKDDALKELEEAKLEANNIVNNAKEEATEILDKAKNTATLEADNIKNRALAEIEAKKIASVEQINSERKQAEDSLRNEIITVAYALAEKITEKEIDETKHQQLVDDFLKEVGK